MLQHRYRVEFGGFAMLQYRDGTDGQAFHRDTDMRYLEDTIIAVLSLGATRPWCLRPRSARHTARAGQGRHPRPAAGLRRPARDGGRCQADWEHSVPYLGPPGRRSGPRVSIQWRFARKQGRPFQGAGYGAPLHYGRDR